MSAGLTADVAAHIGAFELYVRLEVAHGETVAVLGPNGAGKTTLLNVLAGLIAADRATVTLGGEVLEDDATGVFVSPELRPVGVVFQDYLLFEHLSALDNVAFGLRCRGAKRGLAREEAQAWLERIGLAEFASSRPSQLSSGQAQRVALGRALITRPRLLLLDEPLSALDATVRPETRRTLRSQLASYGGVAVIVTHDPAEAAALADRLVVIEQGRVIQSGTPAELRANPLSPYVADLTGIDPFTQ